MVKSKLAKITKVMNCPIELISVRKYEMVAINPVNAHICQIVGIRYNISFVYLYCNIFGVQRIKHMQRIHLREQSYLYTRVSDLV